MGKKQRNPIKSQATPIKENKKKKNIFYRILFFFFFTHLTYNIPERNGQ